MSKAKFSTLIKDLHTGLIIFVDDDFVPISDPKQILFHIVFRLNEIDYEIISNRIKAIDESILPLLNELKTGLSTLEKQDTDKEWLETRDILAFLGYKQEIALTTIANNIIGKINACISEISSLGMNYGLVPKEGGVSCYNPFFDSVDGYSVRVYKAVEGDKFNELEEEILNVREKSENKYCLLIVDKMLANSQDGNNLIRELRTSNKVKTFFSILFTSQKDDANNQTGFEHYFHFEVSKPQGSENGDIAIAQVSDGLALCAYATFFNRLYEIKQRALESANKLVISSGKENMLYLANKARTEGSTVYNTIDDWFDLLVQKMIHKKLSEKNGEAFDFDFIIGLTKLINSNYLMNSGIVPSAFMTELKELNSFELFNDSVNNLYYPPGPGDIYCINSDLYILAGQDCDLIVRETGGKISRKEKLAEVVKCTFKPRLISDKISVNTDENHQVLILNHFGYDGQLGSLEIEFSSRCFIDFRVLDLCSLNDKGESTFDTSETVSETAINALPQMWEKYIPDLIGDLKEKIKIQKFIKDNNINTEIVSSDKSFTLDISAEENKIKYPVKRISRLKGDFKEYLLQKYWEYKTRKGLNTIGVSSYKEISISSLKYGFYKEGLTEKTVNINASLKQTLDGEISNNKLDLIIEKEQILTHLTTPFKELLAQVELDTIPIKNPDTEYTDEATGIRICKTINKSTAEIHVIFPFYNETTKCHIISPNEKFSLVSLLGEERIKAASLTQDSKYKTSTNKEVGLFAGGNPIDISIKALINGVSIPEMKISIKADGESGKIIVTEEQSAPGVTKAPEKANGGDKK